MFLKRSQKKLLRNFDLFPKSKDEVLIRTGTSGVISLFTWLILAFLLLYHFGDYLLPEVSSTVTLDSNTLGDQLHITFDIEMPGMPCTEFAMDFFDNSGDLALSTNKDLKKIRQPNGGCRVKGHHLVNKVKGEFNIAFGKEAAALDTDSVDDVYHPRIVHRFNPRELDTFNASHIVHKLSFGEDIPGVPNMLDDHKKIFPEGLKRVLYFIHVIPSEYSFAGALIDSNQYTYTEHLIDIEFKNGRFWQPGVFFKYDISPYMVKYDATREPFSHFITQLCAVLGGIFAVSGIISSCYYHCIKGNYMRKVQAKFSD